MGSHGNEITSSDIVILNLQGMWDDVKKNLDEVEWFLRFFSYGLTVNTWVFFNATLSSRENAYISFVVGQTEKIDSIKDLVIQSINHNFATSLHEL